MTPEPTFLPSTLTAWFDIGKSIFTVTALLVAALFAYLKLGWFRTTEPHINLEHRTSHRDLGHGRTHLSVNVTIHNNSNVVVKFREGLIYLQQLNPLESGALHNAETSLLETCPGEGPVGMAEITWPFVKLSDEKDHYYPLSWDANQLRVEPDEREIMHYQFIFEDSVKSVGIYTFFWNDKMVNLAHPGDFEKDRSRKRNLTFRHLKGPSGWAHQSVYDIESKSSDPENQEGN